MVARTILVTNIKGGCGKTTAATTIAVAYAATGTRTALADIDRQKSSLEWLARRGPGLAAIEALDWRHEMTPPKKKVQRLVVDSPAAMRNKNVRDLIRDADAVVVPLQPSILDESSTKRFIKAVRNEKTVVKGKLPLFFVLNRVRPRSIALKRAIEFLAELEFPPIAQISDRAAYEEMIESGRGIFDSPSKRTQDLILQWQPLLSAIETKFNRA